jgi:hypothetical protein
VRPAQTFTTLLALTGLALGGCPAPAEPTPTAFGVIPNPACTDLSWYASCQVEPMAGCSARSYVGLNDLVFQASKFYDRMTIKWVPEGPGITFFGADGEVVERIAISSHHDYHEIARALDRRGFSPNRDRPPRPIEGTFTRVIEPVNREKEHPVPPDLQPTPPPPQTQEQQHTQPHQDL